MSKKFLIIIGIVIIVTLSAWLLFRGGDAPLVETIKDVLPFGSGEDINIPTTNDSQPTTENVPLFDAQGAPTSNLFRLSEAPVAGAGVFTRTNRTVVRYVDRATGHIYEIVLPSSLASSASTSSPQATPLARVKITNTTLPKIYEAYFRPDGTSVLLRSLKSDTDMVENVALTLTPPASTSTQPLRPGETVNLHAVAAAVLRGDIDSVAVGTGNTLFYSLKDSGTIVSSAFNNTALKTIFTSAFTDWRLTSAGNNLVIYTKASSNTAGYAYTLNPTNGTLTKLLGPLNALTVTPDSSGTRIIYSYKESGVAKSAVKNTRTGATLDILPVTLAEKCVWSVKSASLVYCGAPINDIGAEEPENWYRGRTSYSDRLWVFDTDAEIAQVLVEPKPSYGLDLDVVEPKLSPAEDYLIFMNKSDSSLWVLKLESF